jgi:hypothetical protein
LGQTSSLTSTAVSSGTSPYSYQWLEEAPGASSYSAISGATSPSYSFVTSGSTAVGSWNFELKVTDSASTPLVVESTPTSVMVNSALIAPTASAPSAVDQGQTISLTSTSVSTGTSPYLYQWFSMAPSAGSYTAISGAISSIFNSVTSGSTTTGSWSFILQVTDATGASVNSTAVPAAVNPPLSAPAVSASSNEINAGQTSTLSSATMTTGSAPYSYQWFEKLSGEVYTMVGGNSASFDFVTSGSTTIGSWSFILQVTDATGASVNSTDTDILVQVAPTIVPTPTPTPVHTPTPTASPSPKPTPTASPTESPTASPSPTPSQSSSAGVVTYAVIGVVIALVIVGVVVVLIRRKHKP